MQRHELISAEDARAAMWAAMRANSCSVSVSGITDIENVMAFLHQQIEIATTLRQPELVVQTGKRKVLANLIEQTFQRKGYRVSRASGRVVLRWA